MRLGLQPKIRSNKKPERFAVCDIEVANWVNFLVLGDYDGYHFNTFENLLEYFDFLWERDISIIYAHFGGKFDFMFLIESIIKETDYTIKNMIPRGSGLLCFDLQREVIKDKKSTARMRRKLIEENSKQGYTQAESVKMASETLKNMGKLEYYSQKISFRDSSALLPFALRTLAESFKVEHLKLDIDYSKITKVTPQLIKYLEHDCKALYEVLHKFHEWPLIKKAGSAPTMAGQALKVLQLYLHKEIPSISDHADKFVRKSYVGGRTEIFKPLYIGSRSKPLYCYDVNSLYPMVMSENQYPTRFKHFTYDYDPSAMGFFEATVEVPKGMTIPPLPVIHKITSKRLNKKNNFVNSESSKLIFPTGRFSGIWSIHEIEYARSLGVKLIRTGKGAIFDNGGFIFREYIYELYKMRQKAKEEGDGVGDILSKLLMNSCYGRFGMSRDKENLVFDEGQEGVKFHCELNFDNKNIRLMRSPTHLDMTFGNVAIAAYVTSYARTYMHKLMLKEADNIYYTDTDSMFTTKKFQTSDDLGGLKLEYDCFQACFLLPKTYFIQGSDGQFKNFDINGNKIPSSNKLAMKGFDKKKIGKFSFDDFLTALEGDLRRLKVKHDPKFATFKSAVRRNAIVTMLPEMEKGIKAMYDKRIIFKNSKGEYDTRPHHLGG